MVNTKTNQYFDVKYLIDVILRNWILLTVSVFFFLAMAVIYLKISSRTFLASTKILINVENQGRQGGTSDYLNVTDLMSQYKSIQNELAYIQSTPLVKEVVDEMNLVTTYYMQEGRVPIPRELMFTLTNIYKQSPFIVVIDENHPQPINTLIYIEIRDDESFSIGSFSENTVLFDFKNERIVGSGTIFGLEGVYNFGETVENDQCSFKILLNSNYSPEQFMGKELFFVFNSPSSLAGMFLRNLSVQVMDRESSLVYMSFESSNGSLAVDFLNNLVNKYIEKDLDAKNKLANSTIEFIDNQLSNISGSLGRSEQELQNFRSNYDIMSIDEKSRTLSSQIYEVERTQNELESKYRTIAQIRDYFEANKDSSNFIAPSLIGLDDEVLNNLIQEMTRLTTERQDLISKNQLKSPRLKPLDQNIENYKRVISESLSLRVSAAEDELQEVNARLENMNREVARLPQTQRRLTGLEREYNITDAAYSALLEKRIEAQIARASKEPDCKIIEPVRYQGVTSPNPMSVFAIALILGLLFPLLYILARVFFTDKISNLDEVIRFSDMKQVGSIPHSDSKFSNVISGDYKTQISEAFHTIRSNIVYYLFGEVNKTILITSSVPNEGKSYTSLNLAASFASTHNKTLLINFDLRKESRVFSELVDEHNEGISSYLINRSKLEDIIVHTEIPNLDFIGNGAIPPDPVAFISSARTKELFDKVQSEYDYVIIDSPPYDIFTDAFLLMNFADVKLFVSRIGVVSRKAFRNCLNDFQIKGIENIYMILNDVKNINNAKYDYYRKTKKRFDLIAFLKKFKPVKRD